MRSDTSAFAFYDSSYNMIFQAENELANSNTFTIADERKDLLIQEVYEEDTSGIFGFFSNKPAPSSRRMTDKSS